MARRVLQKAELLLSVLSVLQQRSLSEGEIALQLEGRLGDAYRISTGRILIGLEGLEAEGLLEVTTQEDGSRYRATPAGAEAMAKRADAQVLQLGSASAAPARNPDSEVTDRFEQVAIMFTDLVGSTTLFDRVGDQAAHKVRRQHFHLLRGAIREHGGREVKSLGDGLMVAFGEVEDAARSGLAMQLAALRDDHQLRIGIAAGETALEDDDYFGRPVVVARRLCDAATEGVVLLAGSRKPLIPELPELQAVPCGPLVLKGLSEPVIAVALRLSPATVKG